MRVGPVGLQGVDGPHGEVADVQESHLIIEKLLKNLVLLTLIKLKSSNKTHHFTSRLLLHLVGVVSEPGKVGEVGLIRNLKMLLKIPVTRPIKDHFRLKTFSVLLMLLLMT